MAKKPAAQDEEGEISFTIVKFSLKGSDASLQKGVDALKMAFAQAGLTPPPPEHRQLRSNGARQLPPAAADEPDVEVADEVVDAGEIDDDTPAPTPAARRAAAPRKPKNFKIIKELKFDDVDPTLDDFVAEKKPATHLERYLCIAYWFKHYKAIEDLTPEHFFTAYMHYSWSLPGNAATPIADLRHQKRQLFVAGTSAGTCTINNAGERRVMEMGKADS